MTSNPPLPSDVWDALPVEARALIQAMRLQIQVMQLHIVSLQEQVRSLRERFDSNSRNSSRPPSTDQIHL